MLSICLLKNKAIQFLLLTMSKTLHAVKVDYFIICSVDGTQQSGKLE